MRNNNKGDIKTIMETIIELFGSGVSDKYKELHKNYEEHVVLYEDYQGELIEYFKVNNEEYIYFTTRELNHEIDKSFIIKGKVEEMFNYLSKKTQRSYEELMDSFLDSKY